MEKVILITEALELIEAGLTEDINADYLAQNLFCSKSTIEKLFKYVTNTSIKDYIIRRRMSKAAKDLMNNPQITLLDLAVKYGYGSNESFTRAFKGVWHVNPSDYRKNPKRYELFPAYKLDTELMEDISMITRKKVDISELYECIKARQNCYIVGVDINHLVPINDISYEAGDIAILTALSRLESATGPDDIVFRVGGDEFVALTSATDEKYAQGIVDSILAHNGEPIKYKEKEIPLSLYATSYKIEGNNLRYSELFTKVQDEIQKVKPKFD